MSDDIFGIDNYTEDVFGIDTEFLAGTPKDKAANDIAGLTVALSNDNPETLFDDFVQESYNIANGNLDRYNSVKASINAQNRAVEDEIIIEVLQDQNLEINDRIAIAEEFDRTRPEVDLEEEATMKSVSSYIASVQDPEEQKRLADLMLKTYSARDERAKNKALMAQLINDHSVGVMDIVEGIFYDIAPVTPLLQRHKTVLDTSFAQGIDMSGQVPFTGELVTSMRKEFNGLSESQKEEWMQTFVKNLQTNSGLFSENDWVTYTTLTEVLDEEPEGRDWVRIWENVGELFDITIFGAIASRLGMLGLSFAKTTSVARSISKNPKSLAGAAARILKGGEQGRITAQALGMDAEDVLQSTLPKVKGTNFSGETDILRMAENQIRAENILNKIGETGYLWWDKERLNAVERLKLDLSENGLRTEGLELSMLPGYDGVEVVGYYGKNAELGYANQGAARAAAIANGIENPEVIEQAGQWFFKNKTFHKMSMADTDIMPEGSILATGRSAKWYKDVLAKYSRESNIANMFAITGDKTYYIQSELNKIAKPFLSANNKTKGKVVDKLIEGSKFINEDGTVGKNFTRDELISEGWKTKEIDIYNAYRDTEDVLYLINNETLRNKWSTAGYKNISTGKTNHVARPINSKKLKAEFESNKRYDILNPKTGTTEKKTIEQIEELYENGVTVGKLKFTQRLEDGTDATHVLISKANKTKVNDLPPFVLNYRQGYFTRHYKDPWFIDEIDVNTGKVIRTIDVAPSRAEAAKIADKRLAIATQEGKAGVKYESRQDKALLGTYNREARREDYFYGTGQLYFSPRLETPLADTERISDPVESLQRSISHVSRQAAWKPLLEKSKRNWLNSYRDLTPDGKYPTSAANIKRKSLTDERYGKAVAHWDHINMMEQTQDDFAKYWKTAMTYLSEWVEGEGNNKHLTNLARGIDSIGNKSPFAALKTVSFLRNLAAFPSRQLLLQSSQPLMLSLLEPKYMLTRFWQDKGIIDMGIMMIDMPSEFNKLVKGMAKATGRPVSEIELLIKSFHKTGIAQSIKSGHTLRVGMVQDWSRAYTETIGSKASKFFKNAVMSPLKVGEIGFNLGEYNNLSSNFLISLQRHMRRTGKSMSEVLSDSKLLDSVHGESRGLGLNMSETGQFRWQKGFLSLALQFQGINFKTGLTLLGKNQYLQGADLAKVYAALLASYGMEGWGAGRMVYEADRLWHSQTGNVMPEKMKIALAGGLANYIPYHLMNARIDLAQSISPASGSLGEGSWGTLLMDAITGRRGLFELAGGASLQTVKDAGHTLSTIANLASTHNWKDPDTPLEMVIELAEFLPQMSKYSQARIALETGWWVTKNNNEIARATMAEAIGKQFFGFQPTSVTDSYFIKYQANKRIQSLNEDADKIYTMLLEEVNRHFIGKRVLNDQEREIANLAIRRKVALLDSFPEEDKELIWEKVTNKIFKDFGEKQGIAELIEQDARLHNVYGSESDFFADMTNRMRQAAPEESEELLPKFLEELFLPTKEQ